MNVSISGKTVTINPSSNFSINALVSIEIAQGVITDLAGNGFLGITNSTDWNFTVAAATDVTGPILIGDLSPADNSSNVANTTLLTLAFNEAIQKGTGNILIKENGIVTQTIAVSQSNVTLSGTAVIIDPSDFTPGSSVNVEIQAGAFLDLSNNPYSGITNATAWNFFVSTNVDAVMEINSENNFSTYPNPSNGVFTVELKKQNVKTTIAIYNLLGERIFTGPLSASSTKIDLSNEAKGIYFCNFSSFTGEVIFTKKIIIQ